MGIDVNSLGETSAQWRSAFGEAARWFAELTGTASEHLDDPGLGEWTVRDLVGHTSRALSTVEAYLTADPLEVDIPTAADYYAAAASVDPAAVAERGRAAGEALGDGPAEAVASLAARVVALVAAQPADARCTTLAGTMTLAEYLPTRSCELVVHGCDLAEALGQVAVPPPLAAESAGRLLVQLAVERDSVAEVLLALTGRKALAAGFSVLSGG